MSEPLIYAGELEGHDGAVTCIATSLEHSELLLTGSRDKSIIVWKLTNDDSGEMGYMQRRLTGHSHFVSDVAISSDGSYALSASWDATLRLWEIESGATRARFVGHEKDVLSVAFSPDNRMIVSASRDRTIKIWNTIGQLHAELPRADGHKDWVSCVRFSPQRVDEEGNVLPPVVVSAGWDKQVKFWDVQNTSLVQNLEEKHTSFISSVSMAPDGSLCATGGKDGLIQLWDISEQTHCATLECNGSINALAFNPREFWLCAAVEGQIQVWNLRERQCIAKIDIDENLAKKAGKLPIECVSLAWSGDGKTLYSGYQDGRVRIWTTANNGIEA
ncbi:MAG: hypothetical protein MHM6MM_007961 [Cercozoa sp. M6MM]